MFLICYRWKMKESKATKKDEKEDKMSEVGKKNQARKNQTARTNA